MLFIIYIFYKFKRFIQILLKSIRNEGTTFTQASKNLDTDLKIILLAYQNNYATTLLTAGKISNY